MRDIRHELLACLILIAAQASLHAQSPSSIPVSAPPSSSTPDLHSVELERKLEAISSALAVTHQQLEQSRQEMEQLREELRRIKKMCRSGNRPSRLKSSSTIRRRLKAVQSIRSTLQVWFYSIPLLIEVTSII